MSSNLLYFTFAFPTLTLAHWVKQIALEGKHLTFVWKVQQLYANQLNVLVFFIWTTDEQKKNNDKMIEMLYIHLLCNLLKAY